MPSANKRLRLSVLGREQQFVSVPTKELTSEERTKQYVEEFTNKMIHKQK